VKTQTCTSSPLHCARHDLHTSHEATIALALGLRHPVTSRHTPITTSRSREKRHRDDVLPHSLKPSPPDRPGTKPQSQRKRRQRNHNFHIVSCRIIGLIISLLPSLWHPRDRRSPSNRAHARNRVLASSGVDGFVCVSRQEERYRLAALFRPGYLRSSPLSPCTFAVHEGVHACRQAGRQALICGQDCVEAWGSGVRVRGFEVIWCCGAFLERLDTFTFSLSSCAVDVACRLCWLRVWLSCVQVSTR
jgi:hypothetical protein